MKAVSGVLRVKDDFRNQGNAVIDFDEFLADGASVGDATIHQPRQVGGLGRFSNSPAYMAHLREYVIEDKGRGSSETDFWVINSSANENRLNVSWRTDERRSEVREIGFLVIGE